MVEVSCVKTSLGAVGCVLLWRDVEGDAVAKSDGEKLLPLVLMLWATLLRVRPRQLLLVILVLEDWWKSVANCFTALLKS